MMIGVDMGDGTILVVRDSLLTGSEPPLTMYELAIGRLTAQLADLQTIYSATRSANISMTEQLAEARAEVERLKLIISGKTFVDERKLAARECLEIFGDFYDEFSFMDSVKEIKAKFGLEG